MGSADDVMGMLLLLFCGVEGIAAEGVFNALVTSGNVNTDDPHPAFW